MYSYESFMVTDENRVGFDAVAALIDEKSRADIFLYGDAKSGKTHLLHAAKDRIGNAGMYCATTDFMLRLDLGTDDAFFDRVGAVPVLFIDAFERLFEHDTAPELMRLLLAERDRLGLSTVIASRLPRSAFELDELAGPLSKFAECEFESIGVEGMAQVARSFEAVYRTEESPALSDEAVAIIAKRSNSVSEMQNAIQFLMVGTDRGSADTIEEDDARMLLSL